MKKVPTDKKVEKAKKENEEIIKACVDDVISTLKKHDCNIVIDENSTLKNLSIKIIRNEKKKN